MEKKPLISSVQLLFLSVGSALGFPYTFMPILNAPPANQDVWIVLIITFVYLLILSVPILFLTNKFRGININETLEMISGKFFGKVIPVIFAAFFLFCFTACMLLTAIFINLYIFHETPTWALLLYILVPASYAAYMGAGTIARLATFIVPFIMLTIIVFFVFGMDQIDFGILQPMLADSTFLQLNQGAFLTAARYSEILIFFIFSYYLKKNASINKTYAAALGVFAVSFFLILLPTITVLGVELAKHAWNPYYLFTRQVKGYDFVTRVHALNTLAWFPTILLKLIVYNFMASYVLSGIVKAKSHKKLVIPISIVGFILCLMPFLNKSSTVELLRSDQIFPFVVLPVTFLIPLILVLVYFIRRKKINPMLQQNKITKS